MQKKLIALAITAAFASAPAFADVTVYGKIDAGVGIDSITPAAATAIKSTTTAINFNQMFTSRFGVKATEDLGNGMMVKANLEMQADPAAAKAMGGRGMNLDLILGQGTDIYAGFGSSPVRDLAYTDATGGSNLVGNLLTEGGSKFTARTTTAAVSHDFGGLKATVGLAINSNTTTNQADTKNGAGYEFGVTYKMDALHVGGAYRSTQTSTNGGGATLTSDLTQKDFILEGDYDLTAAKVYAQYGSTQTDQAVGVNTTPKTTALEVGVDVPFTPVLSGFAQIGSGKFKTSTTSQNKTGYTLGAKYALSKNSFFYGAIGENKMDSATPGNVADKIDQIAVGMVHGF